MFLSDKNCFVRQKPRPPGKGGNICSKVAISEEKKYKSQYQTDGVSYGSIAGFEYEKDYEYKIKVSETNYLNYSMDDPAWIERDLFEVISKDKKDSEDLSLHLIPETYYKNILFP